LFELLESRGFTVYLVNARQVKNVSGRKSDVLDGQWLQQLMSFGLLSGAFRPHGDFCALRAVARLREMLLRCQAKHLQHIQKALLLMNLLLTEVISDVVGETGQKIIRAILAGERDGRVLAKHRNNHIKASEEDLGKALQGNWREAHLFALKQAVALYDVYAMQLAEGDAQLEKMLSDLAHHDLKPSKPKGRGGKAISAATSRTTNRAAQALKMAAANLRSSQSALGAYYRRLGARMDKAKAITACAHKLARLIYSLLTQGEDYVDLGQAH
jgi:hypothetical protein